ncbi:hypothetical protein [Paenibacillus glucanolyticus]|nr:hypothetical protein [Paenibacillus glucanolyticus]
MNKHWLWFEGRHVPERAAGSVISAVRVHINPKIMAYDGTAFLAML